MTIFFLGKRDNRIKEAIFVKEILRVEDINKKDKENYDAVLLKTSNVEILRRMVDKAANYFDIFVLGTNDKVNRVALEHKKVKALISPEHGRAFDYTNYRNSGLNQVLCKIAYDNNKTIIENFSEFLIVDKKEKAILLGRILQNAMLCKKYKTKFVVAQIVRNEDERVDSKRLSEFNKILI